jgi:hypothetical protein
VEGFGLQSLWDRTVESLSNAERRQVAFAMAIAREAVDLFVYCEPRLDLTEAQVSMLQVHMSERAKSCCVLCITSSLHDARLLGGPHAQVTRNGGWAWLSPGVGADSPARVLVAGTGLRSACAELALNPDVSQLVLQDQDATSEVLQLSARSGSSIVMHVARVARQNHANVFRLQVEEQATSDGLPGATNRFPVDGVSPVSSNDQHCNVARIALTCQAESLGRTSRTLVGALFVLGAPMVTAAYAAGQVGRDRAAATLNTLDFLVTYIVPFWSLLGVRLLNRKSGLGGLVEPLARCGASRRMLLCANLALMSLACAAVTSASAAFAVLKTAGAFGSDLWISAWVVAVGTSAYVALFGALTVCVRRTWVPWAFLLADLTLGGTALGLSAMFPHAHLLNLIGAPGVIDLAPRTSLALLGALIVLAFGLTWLCAETLATHKLAFERFVR